MANRVSGYENTRKRHTVDWKYFRVEEDMQAQIQDMDFMFNNVVGGQQHPRGTNLNNIKATQTDIATMIGSNLNREVPDSPDVTGNGLF